MEAKEWFDKFCQQVELEGKCKEKAWNIWVSVSSKIKEKSEVYENSEAHLLFSLFKEANYNLHQDSVFSCRLQCGCFKLFPHYVFEIGIFTSR